MSVHNVPAELGSLGKFDTVLNMTETTGAIDAAMIGTPWIGRTLLVPPYGPVTRQYMSKMAKRHHGTAFLAARPETVLFQRYVFAIATAVLFVEGRMSLSPTQRSVPVALVAYGEDDAIRLRRADIKGHFMWLDGAKRTGERTLI